MKTEFKAHPLMIFSGKTPLLLLFIVPIVRTVFWYIVKGKTPTFSLAVWVGVVFVLVVGVLRMMSFRLIYCNNTFTINKGWLFKSSLSINKSSVSSIEVKQNPIEWLFRAKTLCINTEASQTKKSEFKIKLYIKDCETVRRMLYNCENRDGNNIPPLKALLAAVFTSSAFTGLIIGVPIINNVWTSRFLTSTPSCASRCAMPSVRFSMRWASPPSTSRTIRRRLWRFPTASPS